MGRPLDQIADTLTVVNVRQPNGSGRSVMREQVVQRMNREFLRRLMSW